MVGLLAPARYASQPKNITARVAIIPKVSMTYMHKEITGKQINQELDVRAVANVKPNDCDTNLSGNHMALRNQYKRSSTRSSLTVYMCLS